MGSSASWIVLAMLLATGGAQQGELRRTAPDPPAAAVAPSVVEAVVQVEAVALTAEAPGENAVPEPGAALLFGIGALILRASVRGCSMPSR